MKNYFRFLLAFVLAVFSYLLVLPVALLGLAKWAFVKLVNHLSIWFEPDHIPRHQMLEFAHLIGWKPKANLDTYYLARWDDIHHVRTDHEGWPGVNSIVESEVVVFGDSFAFGYGIDTEKSYLQRDPQLQIKAIAAPGYNMVQELLLMRRYSEKLQNKLVLWFVYLENDIFDNLMPSGIASWRSPFLRQSKKTGAWEIIDDHLKSDPWKHSGIKDYQAFMAKLCFRNNLSERAFSACDFLIQQARDVCSKSNAALIIVTIPYVYQLPPLFNEFNKNHAVSEQESDPDYPDQCIESICRKNQVEFFPLKKILEVKDYKKHEKVHWEESGHTKVAKLISQANILYKNKTLELLQAYTGV